MLTLAPFGFLLPFAAPRLASWRRMALAALLFPLAIEPSQLAISFALGYSYRATDIDDVLLNFVGVLSGYTLFVFVRAAVATPAVPAPESPGGG